MIYSKFQNLEISSLGMGCMRLPHLDTLDKIDIPAVKKMVAYAMEKGVNYYDTASDLQIEMQEKLQELSQDYILYLRNLL